MKRFALLSVVVSALCLNAFGQAKENAADGTKACNKECVTKYKHYAPVNPNTNQVTRNLLEQLYTSVDQGKIYSGLHHNQLNMPNYARDLKRIDEAVPGAIPVVWGGDVAWDADKVVEMATDHHKRGYIISITWHAARPFDKGMVRFKEQTQGPFSDKQ